MTTLELTGAAKHQQRQRDFREMVEIQCSSRWLAAGVGTLVASGVAVAWGGLPVAATLGTLGAAGFIYTTLIEPRSPVLERVTVSVPTLPPACDGLRIGQLSDMHLGMPHARENTRWAVQQMLREQPDLIVITGDFVSFEWAIRELAGLFAPLHAPLGVYAITGNHDHWEGVQEIYAQLEPQGIRFLINDNCCIRWRGGELWLAGIDDMWYGAPDLSAALAGIPADAFTLLLAHEPDFADIAALRPVDLQLSGHTHGGHVHLPLLGAGCVPHHGVRYIDGLLYAGELPVYVSRGLGGLPVRLNCPPEATIITLRHHMG